MKYMHKKGEDFLIPYDEFLYDAMLYDIVEAAPEKTTKPKKAKPAAEPSAPVVEGVAELSDDDYSFD